MHIGGFFLAVLPFVLQIRTMTATSLGALELTVLLAVVRLGDDAYGLAIRSDVSARTRRDHSVGAVYTTLQRLEEKGCASAYTTEPLPVRGGRSRKQLKVTGAGQRALREARRVAVSVWDGLGTIHHPEPA